MSEDDTQEQVAANEETIEFSSDPFDDSPEPSLEEAKPETEPTAEPVEDKPEDTPAPEQPEGEEAPAEPEADKETVVEEKSEPDLKQMTRAERREYFENLERQQRRQVEEVVDANYQPQPVDELTAALLQETDEYGNQKYTQFEAQMLAERAVDKQKAELAEAKAQIAEVNMAIQTDAVEVMSTMPWTDQSKPDEYDKDTAEIAGKVYDQLLTVKDPRTGQVVDAKIPLKQWYTIVDTIRNSGSAKAQLKAQKAAEAQMAAAAPPSSTAPPKHESAEDKQAAGLERAFNDL